jgi:hypothetical protein
MVLKESMPDVHALIEAFHQKLFLSIKFGLILFLFVVLAL